MTKVDQLRRKRDQLQNELRMLELLRFSTTLDPDSPEFERERELRGQIYALDEVISHFAGGDNQ